MGILLFGSKSKIPMKAKEEVTMKELEVIKEELASYLKIVSNDKYPFTYYTFDYQWIEAWNLIGFRYLKKEPLLLDIRLMHIEQEARDYAAFVAERDADGGIMFNPDEYLKIIALVELQILQKEVIDEERPLAHFTVMDADEILQIHYPPNLLQYAIGHYYCYSPADEAQLPEMKSVISLPHWSTRVGANQITDLTFATFTQQQLADPHFDLLDDASGTIRFNQQALEELVILLKRRIFRLP